MHANAGAPGQGSGGGACRASKIGGFAPGKDCIPIARVLCPCQFPAQKKIRFILKFGGLTPLKY
ncbi:hypothetical protein SBBP1_420039 [Burkholderiales bacterium]|nr:hypothetical protein SBBP1_420039 [Burkholderiales bacterium]